MTIECDIVTLVSTHTFSFILGSLVGVAIEVFVRKILREEG